jgi:DNA helicase-2/ATP-dependent DNA helicase PcrA
LEPSARLLADASRYQLAARVVRAATGPFPALAGSAATVASRVVDLDGQLRDHLVAGQDVLAHDRRLAEDVTAALAAGGLTKGHQTELRAVVAATEGRRDLLTLVEAYRKAKRDAETMDFGDQMAFGARLALECPEVGLAERARFRVVLLDEYQDTSVSQRRMLAALFGAGHAVTAVGDPCQAIYGWRGASVSNLDGFPRHFPTAAGQPARRYPLTANQRSGEHLVAAANLVAQPLRLHHDVAELQPRPGATGRGQCRVALLSTWGEELAWMARAVVEARGGADAGPGQRPAPDAAPLDTAVLVRVRSDMPAVEAALTAVGLPVEVVGLGGLLADPAVADVHATLCVLDDPTANAALLRLLAGPRWRVGRRDLHLLGARAGALVRRPGSGEASTETDWETELGGTDPAEAASLSEALADPGPAAYSAEARARFAALAAELRELRRHLGEPLLDLVQRVVRASALDVELAASGTAAAARGGHHLAAFTDFAVAFTDLDGRCGLTAFLAFLAAAALDGGLDAGPTGHPDPTAVKLMTIHQSKGLEWAVVALPDVTASVFPATTVRDVWVSTAHTLPAPLRGDFLASDGRPSLPAPTGWSPAELTAYREQERAALSAEELRLAYVATTRAKQVLIASGHWWGPTQKRLRGPSPLLETLRQHVLSCPAAGEVVAWQERPTEQDNPSLSLDSLGLCWPEPGDGFVRARREEAAAAVRRAVAGEHCGDAGLGEGERRLVAEWDRDLDLLLAEAATRRDRRLVVDMPATLTASQVVLLRADAPRLAAELARPMPRPPVAAATLGTRFHAWVEERFSLRPLLDADELPGAGDPAADGDADAELAELKRAFEASVWAERAPYGVEVPFDLVLGGHVVRGRIDAVYREGAAGWHVVDWKTGWGPSDPTQLAIYRLAWSRLTGSPLAEVRASFLTVRTGELVTPAYLPGEAELLALLDGGSARHPARS